MSKIEFIPTSKKHELVVPPPKPAEGFLPDWYKEMKMFAPDNKPRIMGTRASNFTVKACGPFFDALTAGYIQETWCDIWIESNTASGEPSFSYAMEPRPLSTRPKTSVPIDTEWFYDVEFTWHQPWVPKTPNGWSVLVTSPLNYFNLPFVSTTGVIDSDVFHHAFGGNHPFYIRKGFSGLIPAGTPMFQFIPIKRDSWNSVASKHDEDRHSILESKIYQNFFGGYRKHFQKKKHYK